MPLLSVFGSTAMTPFIMCDIQSHPPELVWAEHWSPSTCGHLCLQLLWLLDIRLPLIIPCMVCLNPPWLVIDQTMTCDSPVTQNVKNQPVAVANLWILFPPTPKTAMFTDKLYKIWQLWLDFEDWIPSFDLHRFSSVKYEVFFHAHQRRCHHQVGHTYLTHGHLLHGQSAHICQLHATCLSIYHMLVKWHFYNKQFHAHCVQDMLHNIHVIDW
jgi:hypothetical protein